MTAEVVAGRVSLDRRSIAEGQWEKFAGMSHVWVKYLRSTPTSVAGLMRLDAGAHEVRHLHLNGEHHAWVLTGEVQLDGRSLDAGSYLHVPAGDTHTLRTTERGCMLFFVFLRTP